MNKNSLAGVFTICLAVISTFSACAQSHKQAEDRLKNINAISSSSVLLNNQQNQIPVTKLASQKFASVDLGFTFQKPFDSLLNKYADVKTLSAIKYKDSATLNDLEDDLKFYSTVIVNITGQLAKEGKILNFISNVAKHKQVIIAAFGDGKTLSSFDNLTTPIVWSPTNSEEAAMVLPQIIFGGISANATLSKGFSTKYIAGTGFKTTATRLKYTVPEDANVNSEDLAEVDKIAAEAIAGKAAPGIVVLVAKDGKVIYNKAFGYHTYDNLVKDQVTNIFDMASVTKTSATTPTIMRLVEEGKLNLDTNIGFYIPKARNTPMNNIKVREVMLHQAGFIPYIPFHNFVKEGDYSRDSSAAFPTKVADNYYIKKGFFTDFMWP
ncbi:MAG: class A beta-lactamase-related serine hydrolase, partial [Flavobacteriales bacterium]